MDIPWDDVRLFLAVVENGSLSGAARKLRIAQPTVSRRIAELEGRLAEPLFLRATGGATLTPFGEGLLEPARRMAESAGELTRAAERVDTRPEGAVRITAAPGVAFDFVAPFAGWLRTKLPGIRIELVSSLHNLDLVRREADLALRMQHTPQKDLVCLAELVTEVGAFASPSYAERLPRGYAAHQLDWIGWAPPLEHLAPNPQLAQAIPGFRPAFASDDFIVQYRAAEVGLGAIALGRYEHRFAARSLVELDVDLGPYRGEMFLLAARSALAIPRVRTVADLLATEIGKIKTPRRRATRRTR